MAAGLTDAQIEEFKEAFTLYDRNMDGTITSKDLGNVLKAIGQNPSDEETRNLVERVSPFNIFGIFDQTKDIECEKLKICAATNILREINFGKFGVSTFINCPNLAKSKSKVFKIVQLKVVFFSGFDLSRLISRKICVTEKYSIFTV